MAQRNKRFFLALALLCILPATSQAIGIHRMLPADTDVIVSVNLKPALVLTMPSSLEEAVKIGKGLAARQMVLTRLHDLLKKHVGRVNDLGYDPIPDIHTLTIGGKANQNNSDNAVLIAAGNFDALKFERAIREFEKKHPDKAATWHVGGVRALHIKQHDSLGIPLQMTLLQHSHLLLGQSKQTFETSVLRAVGKKNDTVPPTVMEFLNTREDQVVIITISGKSFLNGIGFNPNPNPLRTLRFGATLAQDVKLQLVLDCVDEKTAMDGAAALTGIGRPFLQNQAGQRALGSAERDLFVELANSLTARRTGTYIELRAAISYETLAGLAKEFLGQ